MASTQGDTPMAQPQKRVRKTERHAGERVVLLRHRKGWTAQELATYADVHLETVRRIEQGYPTSEVTLEKIALALETTIAYLETPID